MAFWSQAGGQYHLDLMFWPWKFALPLIGAALVVAITSHLANGAGWRSPKVLLLGVSLAAVMLIGGIVTYYYHVNEPADDDDDDQPAQITRALDALPRPAGIRSPHHGGSGLATESLLEFGHIRNHAIHPELRK